MTNMKQWKRLKKNGREIKRKQFGEIRNKPQIAQLDFHLIIEGRRRQKFKKKEIWGFLNNLKILVHPSVLIHGVPTQSKE
ncbi:unnamed protein product [Dovyalis caffra]|uniref:Uncharacterized protein n=1 Tax=Dovyalis caffra TaxID=77055 RepID=A0AAV1RU19_9ROSI|nr:unnamed protein product [Dovyalis caffra]